MIVARDLAIVDLRRLEPHLARVRGFVIERGDLPPAVLLYLAA